MVDFAQNCDITTLHDLNRLERDQLEHMLNHATENCNIGLVLPITAEDMGAAPFSHIVDELQNAAYIKRIVVVLSAPSEQADYEDALSIVQRLGDKAAVLWIGGPSITRIYEQLATAGFDLRSPGKGRSVWTAIGYLLAFPNLRAIALHDCDIENYDRLMLARLCLPIVHPSLDYEFSKAYYSRHTNRMYGRVTRLLVMPLLRALLTIFGANAFLVYLNSFRYPLSGEFTMTTALARSIRISRDWGLEIGTLAEVHRNVSVKRICQVDLCLPFEHKHQQLSLNEHDKGLMRMAMDILMALFQTLASAGAVFEAGHFITMRAAYLRMAQDAIRQFNADALINGLIYERDKEEQAVEAFAALISEAGRQFGEIASGGKEIPNWTRIISAFPELPSQLLRATKEDRLSCL